MRLRTLSPGRGLGPLKRNMRETRPREINSSLQPRFLKAARGRGQPQGAAQAGDRLAPAPALPFLCPTAGSRLASGWRLPPSSPPPLTVSIPFRATSFRALRTASSRICLGRHFRSRRPTSASVT
ncbi:uncharacterized protein C1orf127 homolog isoform X2 [Macrotis lagotis]|uniref:uncharacterized protein C1orf127 homolog isoform X2 n=1 Tax=Macrotis lagotis TaxID=92651 RepID=UPI003D6863C9